MLKNNKPRTLLSRAWLFLCCVSYSIGKILFEYADQYSADLYASTKLAGTNIEPTLILVVPNTVLPPRTHTLVEPSVIDFNFSHQ